MLELLESEVWGPGSQIRPYTIFRIQMTRNVPEKQNSTSSASAFAEDVDSVFHPLISGAAVFRRCKLDRILKRGEETRDSAKTATGEQIVPNFPG